MLRTQLGNTSKRFGREINTIQQSVVGKGQKKTSKKQASLEIPGEMQGFEEFSSGKPNFQLNAKGGNLETVKRRSGRTTMAAKILQLRTENSQLRKQLGQRDERLKSLFSEAEHLRKRTKEAICSRDIAISQVRESERLFEKLEAMEPLISHAGVSNEQVLNSRNQDLRSYQENKGNYSVDHDEKGRSKGVTVNKISSCESADSLGQPTLSECKSDFDKNPRKKAFKKRSNILNKTHTVLHLLISKVNANNQLESHLKVERDALATAISKIKKEVPLKQVALSSLSKDALNTGSHKEQDLHGNIVSPNLEGRDMKGESDHHSLKVEKGHLVEIISAVKEQKKKLFEALEKVEVLQKEKVSLQFSFQRKQKRVSEMENLLYKLDQERVTLIHYLKSLDDMLKKSTKGEEDAKHKDNIEDNSLRSNESGSDDTFKKESMDSLNCQKGENNINLHAISEAELRDFKHLLKSVKVLLKEKDERRAENKQLEAEKDELERKFHNLQNILSTIDNELKDETSNNGTIINRLKDLKGRKDELETFLNGASVLHRELEKNIQILRELFSHRLKDPHIIDEKSQDKFLVSREFSLAVADMPNIVTVVTELIDERRELDAKVQQVEAEKVEVEMKRIEEHKMLTDESLGSQKELDQLRHTLKFLHALVASDSSDSLERNKETPSNENQLNSFIIEQIKTLKTELHETSASKAVEEQKAMDLMRQAESAKKILIDVLELTGKVEENMMEDAKEFIAKAGNDRSLESLKFAGNSTSQDEDDNQLGLVEGMSRMKENILQVQSLRQVEKLLLSEEVSRLNQEAEHLKIIIKNHKEHSEVSSMDWNEKLSSLTEENTIIQQERDGLMSELSETKAKASEQVLLYERSMKQWNENVASLEEEARKLQQEKEQLNIEVDTLRKKINEQSLQFEVSRKDWSSREENLEKEVARLHNDKVGSSGEAEDLRNEIKEQEMLHEQSRKELIENMSTLQNEIIKLQHERAVSISEVEALKQAAKEQEVFFENLKKEWKGKLETLKQEADALRQDRAGSTGEVLDLKNQMKDQEIGLEKSRAEWNEKMKTVSEEVVKLRQERDRLSKELEDLKRVMKENKTSFENSGTEWEHKFEALKKEIFRLGGYDISDDVEKKKRQGAAEKVRDFSARASNTNPLVAKQENTTSTDLPINPLKRFATFQVDLLVNSKAHKQLEVSGTMGGLCQAAIHYFYINAQLGEVTFENGNLPGSQSSNMLIELMLLPANDQVVYESKAGDVLGLSVKVKAAGDRNTREILYNNNVIRTDEVMEAIKGQPIDNFSLWPDLVSSWKWERSTNKGWSLVCIKWRFLLKNIFPELSEPLQTLCIYPGATK